ncbi:hypothetical protein PIB30_070016 [Stylosanthes scabra]|uniref:Uncharacterized protein n=1 Tax=Stylosanthes scabra TaxID=79078 RepID=A0ABU6UM23_9FABA|nr:hypothetical protein [Stylosanthes scabra]
MNLNPYLDAKLNVYTRFIGRTTEHPSTTVKHPCSHLLHLPPILHPLPSIGWKRLTGDTQACGYRSPSSKTNLDRRNGIGNGLPMVCMCDRWKEGDKSFAQPQTVYQSELWIESYRDRNLARVAEELTRINSCINSPPTLSSLFSSRKKENE